MKFTSEIWDFDDEHPRFVHTTVYVVTDDHATMYTLDSREDAITDDVLQTTTGIEIPAEHIWPEMPLGMHRCSILRDDIFLKGPNFGNYDILRHTNEMPADLLLREARIFEDYFRSETHPNIARYLGCFLGSDGRVRGLCFERYDKTLRDMIAEQHAPFDAEKLIEGIQAGVRFIHSKGLVHNDLHLGNIMLTGDGTPVIIDLDAAQLEGAGLGVKRGVDKSQSIARFENDLHAVQKIFRALLDCKTGNGNSVS